MYLSAIIVSRLSYLGIFLMLSACGNNEMSDLKDFIQKVKAKPSEGIEELEEIRENNFFSFELDGSRDPFVATKTINEEQNANKIDAFKKISNGIQPNFTRIKEDLESFPLGALQMVGTVKKNQALWGLIQSEEGVHKVNIGNYIGQNHGKIIKISETGIKLEEILQEENSVETWIKQEIELPLKIDIDE